MILKFKRLKIFEQLTLVVFFSVLIPLTVTAVIVNNVNQHAIRNELRYSALIISEMVCQNIKAFFGSDIGIMSEIELSLNHIGNSNIKKQQYLNDIVKNSKDFKYITLIESNFHSLPKIQIDKNTKNIILHEYLGHNQYLKASINNEAFQNKVFNLNKNDKRQIFLLDPISLDLIASHNFTKRGLNMVKRYLPQNLKNNQAQIYGKIKNEPIAYYKMSNPDFLIIVNTTNSVAKRTIYSSRFNILSTIIIGAIAIMLIVSVYTYYLYINIRQLMKGIIALSKGNYKRKIRLLINFLTPFEVVFLAFEFNKMVYEINLTYRQLKKKNKELKKLDEFRANLIDTVSHELRTPLTSILGYTSRLLRNDIKIEKDIQIKSLKIIKKQAERLSTMVEDLLVVPDIEDARLNISFKEETLSFILNSALLAIKDPSLHSFNIIQDENIKILTDKNRLEQVFINLIENATKYAYPHSQINIKMFKEQNFAVIVFENEADYIQPGSLQKLFEKFTRLDDKTTRTTRGTGLGLYIVKGLVKALNGHIIMQSFKNNTFRITLKFEAVD